MLSGFFATQGVFGYHQRITAAMRRQASTRSSASTPRAAGDARHDVDRRSAPGADRARAGPRAGGTGAGRADPRSGSRVAPSLHGTGPRIARDGTTILLVTHHVDEIIPEIARVILLRQGRIARDSAKADVLTADHLSHAFDAPLTVDETDGSFHVRVGTARSANLA